MKNLNLILIIITICFGYNNKVNAQFIFNEDRIQYNCSDPIIIPLQNATPSLNITILNTFNLIGVTGTLNFSPNEYHLSINSLGTNRNYGTLSLELDDGMSPKEIIKIIILDCCYYGLNPDLVFESENLSIQKPSGIFNGETVLVLDELLFDVQPNIQNSTFYFAADARVEMIIPGNIDIIKSNFLPTCDHFWAGIIATGSNISINLENSHFEGMGSGFQLTNDVSLNSYDCIFKNNFRCLKTNNYSSSNSPIILDGNTFSWNNNPFTFASFSIQPGASTGVVRMIEIDNCNKVVIGSAAYTINSFNGFSDDQAINISNSTVAVKNCSFNNWNSAIGAQDSKVQIGGASTTHGSSFVNNINGLISDNSALNIINNSFDLSSISISRPSNDVINSVVGTRFEFNQFSNQSHVNIVGQNTVKNIRLYENNFTNSLLYITNSPTANLSSGLHIKSNNFYVAPPYVLSTTYNVMLSTCSGARMEDNDFGTAPQSPGVLYPVPCNAGLKLHDVPNGKIVYNRFKDLYRSIEGSGDFSYTSFNCNFFSLPNTSGASIIYMYFENAILSDQHSSGYYPANSFTGSPGFNYKIVNSEREIGSQGIYYHTGNPFNTDDPTLGSGISDPGNVWKPTAITSNVPPLSCQILNKRDPKNTNFLSKSNIKFICSPNPFSNNVTIQSSLNIDLIQIYDSTGELIDKYEVNGNQATLNLADYKSGFYFFKVSSSDYSESIKMIKL